MEVQGAWYDRGISSEGGNNYNCSATIDSTSCSAPVELDCSSQSNDGDTPTWQQQHSSMLPSLYTFCANFPPPPSRNCLLYEYQTYTQQLFERLKIVSEWITAELNCAGGLRSEYDELFEEMDLYYVQASEQLPQLREVFTCGLTGRKSSVQTHLWWELCRARALARGVWLTEDELISGTQSQEEADELIARRIAPARFWQVVVQYGLTLESETPVACYSQSMLEEALYLLLSRWNAIPYHPELSDYVSALWDRVATFFCLRPMSEEDFNVTEYRQEFECAARDAQGRLVFPATYVRACGPNYDWTYRYQTRYHEVRRSLIRIEERILRPAPILPPPITPWRHTIKNWCLKHVRASQVRGQLGPLLRAYRMGLAVQPGDQAWMTYKYPATPRNATSVVGTLYSEVEGVIANNASQPADALFGTPHPHQAAAYEWLVLRLLDMVFFHADIGAGGFILRHVVDRENLAACYETFTRTKTPSLVQWFSRYHLFWQGEIHLHRTIWEAVEAWAGIITDEWPNSKLAQAIDYCINVATLDIQQQSQTPEVANKNVSAVEDFVTQSRSFNIDEDVETERLLQQLTFTS